VARRVGLGVIGAGRMGSAHARIVAGLVPEARLVAIADVDAAAAGRLADELGVEAVFDDPAALAASPDVEGVIVAVSTSRHLDVVRLVAAARRDILCEKPLALDESDTAAAIRAAADAGVRLQVGLMRRHDRDHRRAKARLASGELGRPVLFKSLQFDPEPPPLAFCDPAVSGGIFVDMGIHEFDLARWLMDDEVVEVTAYGSTVAVPELATVGDVDSAVVALRFAGGATGTVELARSAVYGEDVRTEVLATGGSTFLGHLPVTHGATGRPGAIVADAVDPAVPRFERAYAEQARAFARAIRDGTPVEPDGQASLAALRIALAADRSMREGRPVPVEPLGRAPAVG
jgi:myo-inositol 2-dehydrogenase/D-chiro-inositol 1-dehydrogenase